MDKVFGYYVFGGALLGALLGLMWAADGNTVLGMGIGALAGTFIGWFAAAAAMERQNNKKSGK